MNERHFISARRFEASTERQSITLAFAAVEPGTTLVREAPPLIIPRQGSRHGQHNRWM